LDKTLLIEYADMKEEIKDLRRRIDEDERKLSELRDTVVMDSVACGRKGKKPLRTVKITGFPRMEVDRRKALLERRVAKLEMLETDLLEKQNEVEEYIEQIEKSEIRIIFRLYYLDNMNWVQVAHIMNSGSKKRKAYSADSCRCKHNRFLEKVEETTVTTV